MTPDANRRDFLKAGAVATATAAATNLIPTAVHAAGGADIIKVGVIGCGGRGSGAAANSLEADKAIHIHALGDVFEEKAARLGKNLKGRYKDRIAADGRVFGGLDAYQKVIDSGVDLVILATPPGFRPIHLDAAIKAKKHVFTEKPVAVDAPGIRKVLALVDEAKKQNLAVVPGTQRRHQKAYLEVYKQFKDGAIGDAVAARCSWNGSGIWFHKRNKGEPDGAYQLRNWYHFLWLCGDHIVEQHVHNLDVINWFMGSHPVKAVGMGGRMGGTDARPDGDPHEVGNIWDHFAIEYEYPNGVRLASYCRHYYGPGDVSETLVGNKGTIRTSDKNYYQINGEPGYSVEKDRDDISPYVQEHIDLIASIRSGKPINALREVAESTFTAILGREAAYSGTALSWDRLLASKHSTMPPDLTRASTIEVPSVPRPGKYQAV
jgi:predicted dehydrogenase